MSVPADDGPERYMEEYVEALLTSGLMEAGRRAGPSKSAARILTPVVMDLLKDPLTGHYRESVRLPS